MPMYDWEKSHPPNYAVKRAALMNGVGGLLAKVIDRLADDPEQFLANFDPRSCVVIPDLQYASVEVFSVVDDEEYRVVFSLREYFPAYYRAKLETLKHVGEASSEKKARHAFYDEIFQIVQMQGRLHFELSIDE